MIVELLLDFFFGIINFLLGLLPTFSFPFLDNLVWLYGQINRFTSYAAYFLPMTDLFLVFSGVLIVTNFQLILWVVNWVIRRIADVIP